MPEVIHMKQRFSGYLPVVIDVETGGVNSRTDALLELGAVFLKINDAGKLAIDFSVNYHVTPFEKSKITAEALRINKIQPDHPFRLADKEADVLDSFFKKTRQQLARHHCSRAVLVGHNAHFDLSFLHAATDRCKINNTPYHRFTCFDTATLGALGYGQSVLARALKAAGISYDKNLAHAARYDAEVTAELFCKIVNTFDLHMDRVLEDVSNTANL
jgi:ribonuclease T